MSEPTDEEYEQKVRSRKYSGPTIPETGALLRLLNAERAKVARVVEAVSAHPDPCADVEPPFSCGWKSAVADVRFALRLRNRTTGAAEAQQTPEKTETA